MPKHKRRYRKKRRTKRLVKKVAYVAKRVKQMTKANFAYLPSAVYSTSANGMVTSVHAADPSTTNDALFHLTPLAAGAGESSRIGNHVYFRRLVMHGYTYQSAAGNCKTLAELPMGRIIIWLVRDNNGEDLNVSGSNTDVSSLFTSFSTSNSINACNFLRPEFRSKIKILVNKRINLNPGGSNVDIATTLGSPRQWTIKLNLARIIKGPTTYVNSTGTMASGACMKNHIFAAFLQQQSVPGNAGSLTSVWQSRISFDP